MHLASRFQQNTISKMPRNHVLESWLQLAFYENASFNLITQKQHKFFRGLNALNTLKYLLDNKFINSYNSHLCLIWLSSACNFLTQVVLLERKSCDTN